MYEMRVTRCFWINTEILHSAKDPLSLIVNIILNYIYLILPLMLWYHDLQLQQPDLKLLF